MSDKQHNCNKVFPGSAAKYCAAVRKMTFVLHPYYSRRPVPYIYVSHILLAGCHSKKAVFFDKRKIESYKYDFFFFDNSLKLVGFIVCSQFCWT